MDDNFEDAADRVACPQRDIHFGLHLLLIVGIDAVQQHFILRLQRGDLFPRCGPRKLGLTHADHVARQLNAEGAEQHLGDPAAGYTGCALAGAGALEHIARVGEVVLQASGEVRVAGTRTGHGLVLRRVARFDRQNLFPVLPIIIGDSHRDRRADGLAVAHAAEDVGRVALDAHATTASIALLAPPQLAVQKRLVDRHTCR